MHLSYKVNVFQENVWLRIFWKRKQRARFYDEWLVVYVLIVRIGGFSLSSFLLRPAPAGRRESISIDFSIWH